MAREHTDTGSGAHTCHVCGRSFESAEKLQRHRSRMHEGWIGRIREALPI